MRKDKNQSRPVPYLDKNHSRERQETIARPDLKIPLEEDGDRGAGQS